MRIQVCEPRPIPEGWTYKRCDIFSKEEFMEMYCDDSGNVCDDCIEYIKNNPKEYYTVSDRIAIREMAMQHEVGSMHEITGRNTTKRYTIDRNYGRAG